MTRIELLNLAREKFKQAGRSVDAYTGIAECCEELALYEPNAQALKTLAAGTNACLNALRVNPDSVHARTRRASLLSRQAERLSGTRAERRWRRASRELDEVFKLRPDFHLALTVCGSLLQFAVNRRYPNSSDSEAGERFKTAVTCRPDSHFALTSWARALLEQAREIPALEAKPLLEDAEKRCQEALAIRPELYIALSLLGDIRYRRADTPGAPDRPALLDQAIAQYNRALHRRPDWLPALTGLAAALRKKASTVAAAEADALREQALVKCREALSLRDDFPPALNLAAHTLMDFSESRRLDEAQTFADKAVDAAPDDPETWRARARLYFARSRRAPFADRGKFLDLAAADYRAADSRGRPSARTRTAMANVTIARAKMADDLPSRPIFLQATAEASTAILVRADWPDAFLAVGDAQLSLVDREPSAADRIAQLDAAAGKLRRAVELEANVQSYTALARCLILQSRNVPVESLDASAVHAQRIRLTEEAIQLCESAVNLSPDSARALIELADAHTRRSQLHPRPDKDPSSQLYERALRLAPGEPKALRGLGLRLLDANQFQDAIDKLRAACAASPDDAVPHADLATALRRFAVQTKEARHLGEAESLVREQRFGRRHYAHRLIVQAAIVMDRAHLTKEDAQPALEMAVILLRDALHYRQAAWPAARLIRATLELVQLTHNRTPLEELFDRARAAIATEPDNEDAQKALAKLTKARAEGAEVGKAAAASPYTGSIELEKAVAEINDDYHW